MDDEDNNINKTEITGSTKAQGQNPLSLTEPAGNNYRRSYAFKCFLQQHIDLVKYGRKITCDFFCK
jgi:hypothetical protein